MFIQEAEDYMRSEAAWLMSYYGRSDHPDLPRWVSDAQRSQFDALSSADKAAVRKMRDQSNMPFKPE